LYNDSLATVSTFYLYDRVGDRDRGVPTVRITPTYNALSLSPPSWLAVYRF
jgi:hypothetical protein